MNLNPTRISQDEKKYFNFKKTNPSFFIFFSSKLYGFVFAVYLTSLSSALSQTITPTETPEIGSTVPPVAQKLEKAGPQVLNDRPWLNELYSWNESFDLDHQQVKPNQTVAYYVANGRALRMIGRSARLVNL